MLENIAFLLVMYSFSVLLCLGVFISTCLVVVSFRQPESGFLYHHWQNHFQAAWKLFRSLPYGFQEASQNVDFFSLQAVAVENAADSA